MGGFTRLPTEEVVVSAIIAPVSVTQGTSPWVVAATDLDIRNLVFATDKVDVSGSSVSATQGTVPWVVSATDLDIRNLLFATDKVDVSGSSVSVNNGAGALAVNIQDGGNSITVDGPLTDAELRASPVPISSVDLDIRNLVFATDKVDVSGSLISAAQSGVWNINNITGTITLPTGAATAANQATEIASLASIDAGIPAALGQTTMANSMPVVIASNQSELLVGDGLSQGGVHGALTLTTGGTSYEAKVNVSRLSNRKLLTIVANDDMFWGYDNSVTTSSGTPLFKHQSITFAVVPNSTFQVWLVAAANNKTARITESP